MAHDDILNEALIKYRLLELWYYGKDNLVGLHPQAKRTFMDILKDDYEVLNGEVKHKNRWSKDEVLDYLKVKPETSFVFGEAQVTDDAPSIDNMSASELWDIT